MPSRIITSAVLLALALAPVACSSSQEKARARLASLRIPYTDAAFVERAGAGDMMAVQDFLKAGTGIDAKGRDGKTALIAATEMARIPMIQFLLDKGADVNAKDGKFKATALSFAADKRNATIVKMLLDKGADPRVHETKSG